MKKIVKSLTLLTSILLSLLFVSNSSLGMTCPTYDDATHLCLGHKPGDKITGTFGAFSYEIHCFSPSPPSLFIFAELNRSAYASPGPFAVWCSISANQKEWASFLIRNGAAVPETSANWVTRQGPSGIVQNNWLCGQAYSGVPIENCIFNLNN